MTATTVYFGNLFFWSEVANQGILELDYNDTYKKQSFRNRQEILSANGKLALSIPVVRPNGSNTLTRDVKISYAEDWQKDHWKAIESAYKHAPYFWYYGEQIKALIEQEKQSLIEYNTTITQAIINFLSLDIKTITSKKTHPITSKEDFRVVSNNKKIEYKTTPYIQVFSDKKEYVNNLSIIDALMNLGPMARMLIIS